VSITMSNDVQRCCASTRASQMLFPWLKALLSWDWLM